MFSSITARKYPSHESEKCKLISPSAVDDVKQIVSILKQNKMMDGIYKNEKLFQQREVKRWFGEKDKVELCFLPTSKEDQTINVGCATVFFEILKNAGISIFYVKYKFKSDGK